MGKSNQRLSLSMHWEGPRKTGQGFKPDSGNLTVRDYRGASENVRHGGNVKPPRERKSGSANPHLQRGASDFYPNATPSSGACSSSDSVDLPLARTACVAAFNLLARTAVTGSYCNSSWSLRSSPPGGRQAKSILGTCPVWTASPPWRGAKINLAGGLGERYQLRGLLDGSRLRAMAEAVGRPEGRQKCVTASVAENVGSNGNRHIAKPNCRWSITTKAFASEPTLEKLSWPARPKAKAGCNASPIWPAANLSSRNRTDPKLSKNSRSCKTGSRKRRPNFRRRQEQAQRAAAARARAIGRSCRTSPNFFTLTALPYFLPKWTYPRVSLLLPKDHGYNGHNEIDHCERYKPKNNCLG